MLPYAPLPPVPSAPPAGATAAQRQAFDDAMELYRAAVAAMQATAQANTAEAIAGTIEAQIVTGPAGFAPIVDRFLATWAAHDAALDRLSAALGSVVVSGSIGGAGGGAEGLTAADVGIVQGLAAALKSAP